MDLPNQSSQTRPILGAGSFQRGRSRLPEFALFAHSEEPLNVILTLPFTIQLGISRIFIDRFATQIGNPRFDVPLRNENSYPLSCFTWFLPLFNGGILDLVDSLLGAKAVSIHDNNQSLPNTVSPTSVVGQFTREPLTHKLLSGSTTFGTLLDSQNAITKACLRKETESERLVLAVLA